MTNILLVGADGQLGREIVRRAAVASMACHAFDVAELDITRRDAVMRTIAHLEPTVVINAAAYTAVDKAETDAEAAFAVNRDGAAHLAEACAAGDIPLIHISTDYVFDGAKQTPYLESDPTGPLGVYGKSKLAGEAAVRQTCPRHVILRTSWLYGVYGTNFVKTMLRLGLEREKLRVVEDQHGSPTFAGDLADAILVLAGRLRSCDWPDDGFGTFHCTGQGATTWCGFAREIFAAAAPTLGRQPEIEAIATSDYRTAARRPLRSVLDCGLAARVHGIALRPWRPALAETVHALLAQSPAELSR
jgi:dTDP-4-dehydrorhamnose reductase